MKHRALLTFLSAALPCLASCAVVRPKPVPIQRAVWVTRWDFGSRGPDGVFRVTEEGIRTVLAHAAAAGFDTVLFQVRGNATAFYESPYEPWSEDLGWASPGFDPLLVATREARNLGIALHAWVNLLPAWRGEQPPEHPDHLHHRRPEWFLHDQSGQRQPLRRDYVVLNPCLAEVRSYLAEVCADLARRYPVQGLHLDYVRFMEPEPGRDYPHDPATLAQFRHRTGLRPDQDPEAWRRFKTDAVTAAVREVRERVRAARPDCVVTAAVFRDFEDARGRLKQDAATWLRRGHVDAVFAMAYDARDDTFLASVRSCVAAAAPFPVLVGVGAWLHDLGEQTVRQMERALAAGAAGVAVFAYSSLFPPLPPATLQEAEARAREDRRRAVEAYFTVRRR